MQPKNDNEKNIVAQRIVLLIAFWESSIQFDLSFEQIKGLDSIHKRIAGLGQVSVMELFLM